MEGGIFRADTGFNGEGSRARRDIREPPGPPEGGRRKPAAIPGGESKEGNRRKRIKAEFRFNVVRRGGRDREG